MKMFFIILLSILVGTSLGVGYFVYKKNYLSNKLAPEQNKTVVEPKTFNYQIPIVDIKNQFSPTSSEFQHNQSKTTPSLENSIIKKQLNINQDYLTYYQNSINNLNKISNSLKNLQQIFVEIEKNYNNKNYLSLPSLVSKASDENSNFIQTVSDLKNSFDGWSIINKDTTKELIKSKTNQVIEAGFNYTQSSFDFS
jgi:hypothetical protein